MFPTVAALSAAIRQHHAGDHWLAPVVILVGAAVVAGLVWYKDRGPRG